MTQQCFKCKRVLPLTEFYKHAAMTLGVLGKCKECTKGDVRQNYRDKRDTKHQYDRERERKPERRMQKLQYQRNHRARHPDRNLARGRLNRAVRTGAISKQPCRICGDTDSQAHHHDYSKPYGVEWLCLTHHREVEGRLCQ